MPENIITEFPVTVYGNLEKYSDTISKARCRIFYKGLNRNGTYITDEFAEKLLASIPYAPVKGIFSDEEDDYTDHGTKRSLGRIYGIVPEDPNVQWESHLDEDGVERTYACVDVLIFSALYVEANTIVGKSQSMELYPKTLKGSWQIREGKRCYVFEEGSFLGLQVLGDTTEPCFEGAAFFSLYKDLKKIVNQIEQFSLKTQNGGKKMLINYKLSDGAKFNALWSLLNTNFNEEGNWTVDFDICDIYDDYAVVKNYAEGIWERVFYTKSDENDSVEINNRERCYIMDVSEAEKSALNALHQMNENTYEKIDENYTNMKEQAAQVEGLNQKIDELNTQAETYAAEKVDFESKIEELNNSISTLTTERDNANTQYTEAQANIENLNTEVASLTSFKAGVEKAEKEQVITKYSEKLNNDVLKQYEENLDNYTAKDLEKELAYALVNSDASIFSHETEPGFVPKDDTGVSGIEEILTKYKNK